MNLLQALQYTNARSKKKSGFTDSQIKIDMNCLVYIDWKKEWENWLRERERERERERSETKERKKENAMSSIQQEAFFPLSVLFAMPSRNNDPGGQVTEPEHSK